MSAWHAFRDGLRRVADAPAVLVGAWLVTLAVGLPLAAEINRQIEDQLGDSLMAEALARGADHDWWSELSAHAHGIATSFTPAILGFAAVLGNVSDLLDKEEILPSLAWVLAVFLVVWTFFSGGVLDRLARQRRLYASGFFGACGGYFFRLLRLALIALGAYALLFGLLHGWLFDDLYERLTHEVTVERTALVVRVLLYGIFGLLLLVVNVIVDYARVRLVVEDRRSATGALLAGARFVARHAVSASGLYGLNTLLFLLLAACYALVAPGATWPGWLLLLIGQLWILARLAVKLQFYASAIALFQSRLAHARYVAAPEPRWPDSPMAEAIGRPDNPRSEAPPLTAEPSRRAVRADLRY
ncbi:MAG: hypothetical protein GEU99_13695 [Luteitalea sp.]|nr:hypothetical protein [Luteitalea sp.]